MVWPPQNTGVFEFKMPCCQCGFKFYIPIFTQVDPVTFPPYATLADAMAAVADQVASCIGFFYLPTSGFDSVVKSAVDGGTSLYMAATVKNIVVPAGPFGDTAAMYGSITAEVGKTLTLAWTYNSTGSNLSFNELIDFVVFKPDGTFVCDNNTIPAGDTDSGSFVTIPMPATGQYIVVISVNSRYTEDPPLGSTVGFTGTLTSSGALSVVKPVVALYGTAGHTSEFTCP